MSDWPYFSEVDERMDEAFMDRLITLRQELNFPLPVTSSYRTVEHNKKVGGGTNSAHLLGRAVDISISGKKAFKLIEAALDLGFTGIGVKQKGPHNKRIIHIDDCPHTQKRPRPRIWSY